MSLICGESKDKILISFGLFCVTRSDSDNCFPLSGEIIQQIPREKWRYRPCEPNERGIDIHRATAAMNHEFFLNHDFKPGEFAFSIPAKAAWELLPNLTGKFLSKGRKRKRLV